jgi:propionyl-CoA synthetase
VARTARDPGALDWFTRPSAASAGTVNFAFNALDRHVVRGLADEPALLVPSAPAGARSFYSYAELLEQVAQLGGAFRELGVTPGRTVVLALPLGPELLVGLLAGARLGAVVVPLIDGEPGAARRLGRDPAVDPAAVVVIDGAYRAALDPVLEEVGCDQDYEVVLRPEPGTVHAALGTFDLAVLMRPGSFQPAACAELTPTDPFLVRLSTEDETTPATVFEQAWAVELAATAVAAGWVPGRYVRPGDDPTGAAPYGALLGPLLVGATVELA